MRARKNKQKQTNNQTTKQTNNNNNNNNNSNNNNNNESYLRIDILHLGQLVHFRYYWSYPYLALLILPPFFAS
jgi:hypothetical protein